MRIVAIVIGISVGAIVACYGQFRQATPLVPGSDVAHSIFGEIGVGGIRQVGVFQTACHCQFDNGVGKQYEVQIGYAVRYGRWWGASVTAGMTLWRWHAAYREYEYIPFRNPATQQSEVVNVLVRNDAWASLQGMLLSVRGVIYPFKPVFFQIGPQLQWWLRTNRRHQQTLETTLAQTAAGQEVWVTWENGTKAQIVEDGQFESVLPVTLGLTAALGIEMPVTRQWYLRATIVAGYALTALDAQQLRLVSVLGMIGGQYLF